MVIQCPNRGLLHSVVVSSDDAMFSAPRVKCNGKTVTRAHASLPSGDNPIAEPVQRKCNAGTWATAKLGTKQF
jgi:hypothetical protein